MARTTKRGKTGKKVAKKAARKRAGSRTTKPAKTTAGAFSTTRARMAAMAAVPDTGPVTLEEARALAHVSQSAMAARAVRKEVAPPISPAAIGVEREKLKAEQRTERARRISEYRATMMVMKRRGARGPRAAAFDAAGGPPAAAADGSFDPLQILAEGDSWFDYPVPFFGGGIIPRLEHRLGVPILNLAKAGDEVRYMLGVEERAVLVENLTNGSPAGGPWDVLLFSGGGNDIVGNPMALWVDDWNPAVPPVGHIKKPRFDAALELVRAGYEDLIASRDQLSPHTMLVFQGYDFALPDGRGICGFGPWLKPTFDLRKFPTLAAGQAVVKVMLQQFAAMLTSLSGPTVTFINGQGTLSPQPSSWDNELHPEKAGFEKFADLFQAKLKVLFPNRVA
jgi:hypothetical protein